jgi:hypothetical protein
MAIPCRIQFVILARILRNKAFFASGNRFGTARLAGFPSPRYAAAEG